MISVKDLYSCDCCDLFSFQLDSHPRSLLCSIDALLDEQGLKSLPEKYSRWKRTDAWVSKDAFIDRGATIQGRCIIGCGATIRSGAVLRDGAVIGQDVLIGHGVEVKRSVVMRGSCLPHMNYVGDSVIGVNVVFGAGVVTANVNLFDCNPFGDAGPATTGVKRFGVFVGDGVRIGCNVVLNPGAVIGRQSVIYPLTNIRGVIGSNVVVKGGSFPNYDLHPIQVNYR